MSRQRILAAGTSLLVGAPRIRVHAIHCSSEWVNYDVQATRFRAAHHESPRTSPWGERPIVTPLTQHFAAQTSTGFAQGCSPVTSPMEPTMSAAWTAWTLTRSRAIKKMAVPIACPMNELPLLATSSRSTAARACGPETLDIASRTIPRQGISASPRPRVRLPR